MRNSPTQGLSDYNNGATERRFSPYSDNGGSVVAIAGEDFCVIASDTRFALAQRSIIIKGYVSKIAMDYSTFFQCTTVCYTIIFFIATSLKYEQRLSGHGYAILSRVQPKLFQLSETTVLGSTGCWCDILTFCKVGVS